MNKPDIYDYLNYRNFLKDYYSYSKFKDPNFSYRTFAEITNFKTRSHLKMIIDGTRNLTDKTKEGVALGCNLTGNDAKYFFTLINYTHEKDLKKQTEFLRDLHMLSRRVKRKAIEGDQNKLLSKWYYSVVRTLVNLPEFKPCPNYISKKLRQLISREEAIEAFDTLLNLGLICERDSKFEIVGKHLTDNKETLQEYIMNYHRQMLELGIRSTRHIPDEDRVFRAITIDISKKGISLIKERIKKFYEDIAYITERDNNSQSVCQINIQLLKLTEDEPE